MKDVVVGIDTSAYTTSICAIDTADNKILFENRKILDVPLGEKGLRQNMAVFQHMKNLPCFIEELFSKVQSQRIACLAVSDKPRSLTGSYMPVFFAGHTYARVLASSLNVPLYTFSHQEGHIAAGLTTLDTSLTAKQFIAIQISGGTSEVCIVEQLENGFNIELIGGTRDLHAGQFIDRVGVKMGLAFPAGKHLEKVALEAREKLVIPSSVKGYDFSFSGPATKAERLLEQGIAETDVARAVEHCIGKTLEKIIRKAKESYNVNDVLVVGGVASNEYIRNYLKTKCGHPVVRVNINFAKIEYSSDNAYGVAVLGNNKHRNILVD
ncbi:hypothetical protein [Desulfuribacillus alkaliarsenatis]|uniref:N(6)-L-threonylcarbamoyladenine synthase n=1 Tax=Desulfuribacillus alkaliarsenatis TaxID=766136 RepID=A0A1E5G5K4_9FIRM|nr:hypothetical protein [Desulfuribacillus alkaliarsenatis]OEF98443.1 hypothetical protein BHF68_01850 [Desulfuribacillus alkaliarsenatis]